MHSEIEELRRVLDEADVVIIGAGAGLSTSAGFVYSGERFDKYFYDFAEKYHFNDMYSGGFYPYATPEEMWAYWCRYIYINRYMKAPKPVYEKLRRLIAGRNYFVITTNVDHCFQKAHFDKERLFYTQGDYGLFQCAKPCHYKTYDNREIIFNMMRSEGFEVGEDDAAPQIKDGLMPKMSIETSLVPKCPVCGGPMTMNLRSDDNFVEDEGWHKASERYRSFCNNHDRDKVVYLELGVGMNTPGIIKYPFWQSVWANENATYVCINYGECMVPREIKERSICIDGDIGEVLDALLSE